MEATYRTYFMRQDGAFNIRFFIFATLALITSGLNPNAYHLFWEYFSGLFNLFTTDVIGTMTGKRGAGSDWVRGVVLEYKPLTYFYKNMGYRWLMFYWIFTVVLYIAMLTKYLLRKSIDLREFFTVSFVVLFANMYARGLMFSLPVMAAYFGKTLFELSPPRATFRRIAIILTSGMLIITLLFGAHTGLTSMQALTPGVTKDWITPWYPTKAVDFLLKNRIAPPMYNYYTWGGFLIWGTYPHYKVFIDGRAIDNNANKTADGILKCYPGWQNKLDVYGINFIIIPLVFRESGYVIPMGRNLAFENKWKLVFIQNNSAIFVRDIPQNREIIQKYGIDKKRIFYEIIAVENL
ncbi:MAG: hypothetical protein GWN61_26775, partial [candidate division Zixibacteria bacterium]|nr:hypothetical protein [candidate division Zixibacteria bacterium]NIS49444.1 hypothetical protein [candidate division Zixibacteria bacterium]NIU17526.1 hypothetical protein [candidate division Zixibacteria bacterium]NIV09675.1 hypothetical protein [candidate division Zixibacteria bacterium]NIW42118.1 hypothetical protein [candidate division Zixibacteria bacterium]